MMKGMVVSVNALVVARKHWWQWVVHERVDGGVCGLGGK